MVMQQLLLQKPGGTVAAAAHKVCTERRIASWDSGDVQVLLQESMTIQDQIVKARRRNARHEGHTVDPARRFASDIERGRLSAATRQLSPDTGGGVLDLDDTIGETTVLDVLRSKHPQGEAVTAAALLPGQPPAQPHHTHSALHQAGQDRSAPSCTAYHRFCRAVWDGRRWLEAYVHSVWGHFR